MPVGVVGEWVLVGGVGQTLTLDGERLFGFGGVNRYTGGYAFVGDVLEVGPIASTRMAGPPEAMQAEVDYLAALDRAARVAADGDLLLLFDEEGAELLRFAPAADSKETPRWS